MRNLLVFIVLVLTACIVHSGLVQDGTIPSPVQSPVTVSVINSFNGTGMYVDVLQFCGQPSQFGPMQPYSLNLGPGMEGLVRGDLSGCFSHQAKSVDVIFNEADYPETCRIAITKSRPDGYKFVLAQPTGVFTKCTIAVKGKYSAVFTFVLVK